MAQKGMEYSGAKTADVLILRFELSRYQVYWKYYDDTFSQLKLMVIKFKDLKNQKIKNELSLSLWRKSERYNWSCSSSIGRFSKRYLR